MEHRTQQRKQQISEIDVIKQQFAEYVNRLIAHVDSERTSQKIRRSFDWLETLPLGTSEYGLAHSRLKNAQRYAESGEWGAARYELRLLLGSFDELVFRFQ